MSLLAQGDLTRHVSLQAQAVKVKSKDEVGQMASTFNLMIEGLQNTGAAFETMAGNLRGIVGQVAENASSLGAASEQLASAANQAGQATSQIATTIQQVAKGTAQQSESVSRTASSVEQMSRAGLTWFLAGGAAYTGGVAFFLWDRLPFNHAIWHLFVLAGSACHFFALLWYVLPIHA